MGRDPAGGVIVAEVEGFIAEGQDGARFKTDERSFPADLIAEKLQVFVYDLPGFADEPFGKVSAGALAVFWNLNGVSEVLKKFNGGDSCGRVLVVGELVVEEINLAGGACVLVWSMVFEPAFKRLPGKERNGAIRVKAGEFVEGAPDGSFSEEEIPGPGSTRSETLGSGKIGDEPRAQRSAIDVVILLLKLGLHLGHVDGGRAFLFAALARKAEVENFAEFVVGEWVLIAGIGDDVAQGVGAGAGGVLFVSRGHVAGTHCATGEVDFAAVAGTIAHFGGAQNSFGGGPIEDGFDFGRFAPGGVTQMSVHRRGVNDLVGIEDAVGIPGAFDFLHEAVVFVANHLGEKFAAEASVAVLSGK